jgi:alkylated DNA repair dioxygenase AlkB
MDTTVVALTSNSSSYVHITTLPPDLLSYSSRVYNQLWNMHPEKRGVVILHNWNSNSYRYHESFGATPKYNPETRYSFMFHGKPDSENNQEIKPIPDIIKPYLNFVNSIGEKKGMYNQVVVNWYVDGQDFIAMHSDCTLGMSCTDVTILSLGTTRNFTLKPRMKTCFHSLQKEYTIPCTNGTLVQMLGKCQDEFRHGVARDPDWTESRISITFRCYNE